MLGLLYLLRTTDIHYENIIAFSANPVLIDLEALFHNRFHILEQNTAPGKITGIIEGLQIFGTLLLNQKKGCVFVIHLMHLRLILQEKLQLNRRRESLDIVD